MKSSGLLISPIFLPSPDSNPFVDTSLGLSTSSITRLENHINPIVGENYDSDTKRGRPAESKEEALVSVPVEEFNRLASENKRLTEMILMYDDMRSRVVDMKCNSGNESSMATRKRKFEEYEWENVIRICESLGNSDEELIRRMQESTRTKVSRVYVQVDPSDMSLNVKDGYHWRKYGQKVTRDNPSPRAYFKCSFAPNCPVKKKVQRSVDDPAALVATYEGQHNHSCPTAQTKILSPNSSNSQGHPKPGLVIPNSGQHNPVAKQPLQETNSDASTDCFPEILVQQMASSLTRDPKFTAALIVAISGRILDQELPENWSD